MLNPKGTFRQIWNIWLLFLSLLIIVELPLRLTLNNPFHEHSLHIEYLVTFFFLTDIIISFFTGVKKNYKYVYDRSYVAAQYLKKRFLVDVISALPFSLLYTLYFSDGQHLFFEILALTRLLRLVHVARFMTELNRKNIFNPYALRLIYLISWVLIFAHFIACIWLYMGSGNAVNTNADYAPEDKIRNYIRALYWTTTTLTTIGYGDIAPVTNRQTLFTIIVQLLGAGMYGFLIGNIASLVANLDIAKAQFREKMEKIGIFMSYHNLTAQLQEKVRHYYDYIWESRRGFDETSVINELPGPLKVEISLFLNRHLIEKVPLFKDARPDCIREIVLNLKHVVYSPGDIIVHKGEVGNEMYFISKGTVEVVGDDLKTVFTTLTEGDFFGEIALLMSVPRTANIRATEYCELYMLDKPTFETVLLNYPDFKANIQKEAEERARELKK